MKGPCEHCGNADKSKWRTQCIYKGDWPSHRAFVRSTFDPPCACDDYDEGQRELARSNLRRFLSIVALIALVVGLGWLGLGWIVVHR